MEIPQLNRFQNLEGLPSLPSRMLNVLDEIGATSAMDYNIVRVVQYDPAIACRVLKAANAPLYGYGGNIFSLQQASGLLGPGAIKNIVLTTQILERFSWGERGRERIDYGKIWRHSAVVAVLAGTLGRCVDHVESDACFTAGLVHDIGKIALAALFPAAFCKIVEETRKQNVSLQDAARGTLGFSPAEISAELTERWGFPPALVKIVGTCVKTDPSEITDKIAGIVHLAKYLAIDWGYPDGMENLRRAVRFRDVLPLLGITEKKLKAWKPELMGLADIALESVDG